MAPLIFIYSTFLFFLSMVVERLGLKCIVLYPNIAMVSRPKNMSSSPGVYFFKSGGTTIYIGKAGNLKNRLFSYWLKNAGDKAKALTKEADQLEYIEADSEIDALIKEAELIKRLRPKYNILMRDDKNYFYVAVTQDNYPKIFITHQPYTATSDQRPVTNKYKRRPNSMSPVTGHLSLKYIGPFTSGHALKITLKFLRGVFPYCTCKISHKRPCLNSQIGRCPGFCCIKSRLDQNNQKIYLTNIKNITAILSGQKKKIMSSLKKGLKSVVKKEDFENATKLRDQILGIENIFRHRGFLTENKKHEKNTQISWPPIEKDIQKILKTENPVSRVECYDIANISGREATGSLVVFTDGYPVKAEYRKFKIKTVNQISDVDMLKEVISRRLKHLEWKIPDLFIIDGGITQLNAAVEIIYDRYSLSNTNIVSLAKREEELYIPNHKKTIPLKSLPLNTAFFFQRMRDEAHRFARVYHHKLRQNLFRK